MYLDFDHAHGLARDVAVAPGTNRAAIRGALGFNRLEAEEQQLWRMIKMARGYSTCRSAQSQDLLPRVARSANQSALQLLLTEDAKAAEETA